MLGLRAWSDDLVVVLFEFLDDDTKLARSCHGLAPRSALANGRAGPHDARDALGAHDEQPSSSDAGSTAIFVKCATQLFSLPCFVGVFCANDQGSGQERTAVYLRIRLCVFPWPLR